MEILNLDLSEIFLPRVADCPGVQRITFISLKPAKRAQNAEAVFTFLLTIFAQGKSEGCKFTIFHLLFSVTAWPSTKPYVHAGVGLLPVLSFIL